MAIIKGDNENTLEYLTEKWRGEVAWYDLFIVPSSTITAPHFCQVSLEDYVEEEPDFVIEDFKSRKDKGKKQRYPKTRKKWE